VKELRKKIEDSIPVCAYWGKNCLEEKAISSQRLLIHSFGGYSKE